ncbi:DMT family transporter [Alginatibacterium sediminis]|uniref:DMT family transporter n=1 Tax=Alginatibacterium sediminis TaxID=2164068 RepID=A0A420E8A6_9ALTE|nr:DMT family transporter [Alginatibacterium sediminis]RKF15716.1 DMT family transporter [Alginatibacterium sediminis]
MSSTISNAMNSKVWFLLILLSVLWGASFFWVGVAVNELPPLTIVSLRVGVAALALWTFALVMGIRPPKSLKVWGSFLGMGILNNVIPFALIVWGQTQIASGLASILNAATPIFAVIVAGLLLPDERPTKLKLFGVSLGFVGVVVMIGVPALSGSGKLLAQLAIVGAAISYAFAGVFGRRFKSMGLNPVVTAAGQVTASALVLIPITLLVDGPIEFNATSTQTWLAVMGLAVFSTAFAYVLYFKILELAGATNVLLVTLLVPVSAVLLGSIFLNETLQGIHLLGMLLIALGLSAIDGRLWKHFR